MVTTVLAVACMLFLLVLCGVGPTLLLIPRSDSAFRILIIPPIGLCSGVVLSMALAQLRITGRSVAILDLLFFSALAILACSKAPPSRDEWRRAVVPVLICIATATLIGWPLFEAGLHNYIAYANPDVPGFLGQASYMNSHPFGLHIKDIAGAEGYYLGVRPDLILGILYFFLMLSLVSGLPIATLFSIGCLSVVILTPAAVYILAEQGLAQSRRVALTAAVLVACSSVQAYTFYLHSLGTLSVMAVGPVAITLAIASLEKPEWSRVTLFAIVCAGMYYNYYPGVAMIAVLVAGVALGGLLDGSIRLRSVILTAGATVAVTFAVFFPYAVNVVKNIAKESWGGDAVKSV